MISNVYLIVVGRRNLAIYVTATASGAYCHPLISFANSLYPDQDQQNVSPDLGPNHWTC